MKQRRAWQKTWLGVCRLLDRPLSGINAHSGAGTLEPNTPVNTMAPEKEYIQLSIFDRLNDQADYGDIGGRINDIDVVRHAVLRDVENLLNTRRNILIPADGFRYLRDSLFVYGLEDFVAKNPRNPTVRKALQTGIEETINRFEPRLTNVAVQFNFEEGNEQNLCFAVRATLHADPIFEPICFDTWFSANRGEYKIDNVK